MGLTLTGWHSYLAAVFNKCSFYGKFRFDDNVLIKLRKIATDIVALPAPTVNLPAGMKHRPYTIHYKTSPISRLELVSLGSFSPAPHRHLAGRARYFKADQAALEGDTHLSLACTPLPVF